MDAERSYITAEARVHRGLLGSIAAVAVFWTAVIAEGLWLAHLL